MSAVDGDYATWLQSEASEAVAEDSAAAAKWGDLAIDTRISTPLIYAEDAQDEANRQLAFRPGPLDVEWLRVPGLHVDMIGRVVTLRASKGGYEAGVDVFVIAADETDKVGGTKFLVLRRA